MDIPKTLEPWSWVAGILGSVVALVALIWQVRVATRRVSRKGDREVMDRAFHRVRIGAPIATLQELGLKPIARSGSGAVKITKWKLDNGNELSVTYDSVQDRILYMEIDWNQKTSGMALGMGKLLFGRSTLRQIRRLYQSNGFSYAKHVMFEIEGDIVTFNAFELKRTPTIVVVFITKISAETRRHISTLPDEKQVLGEIGEHFKLDAIAVADESYLVSVQKQPLPALTRRSIALLQGAQKPINGLYRAESRFSPHCDESQARVGGAGAFGAGSAGFVCALRGFESSQQRQIMRDH